ncbi:hypothetical protein LY78DRAFT_256932 [Colletotrichum sublineola]|nr:hypothetical protein LY78DRAFT_256932 [Colletotrichum sublineola]
MTCHLLERAGIGGCILQAMAGCTNRMYEVPCWHPTDGKLQHPAEECPFRQDVPSFPRALLVYNYLHRDPSTGLSPLPKLPCFVIFVMEKGQQAAMDRADRGGLASLSLVEGQSVKQEFLLRSPGLLVRIETTTCVHLGSNNNRSPPPPSGVLYKPRHT